MKDLPTDDVRTKQPGDPGGDVTVSGRVDRTTAFLGVWMPLF